MKTHSVYFASCVFFGSLLKRHQLKIMFASNSNKIRKSSWVSKKWNMLSVVNHRGASPGPTLSKPRSTVTFFKKAELSITDCQALTEQRLAWMRCQNSLVGWPMALGGVTSLKKQNILVLQLSLCLSFFLCLFHIIYPFLCTTPSLPPTPFTPASLFFPTLPPSSYTCRLVYAVCCVV